MKSGKHSLCLPAELFCAQGVSTRKVAKTPGLGWQDHHRRSAPLPLPFQRPSRTISSLQWLELIRGRWGGVEIRHHWRRDALMGEDRSRQRQPNLPAHLALIRGALLLLLTQ